VQLDGRETLMAERSGAQELGEDFERVGAVASSADSEGCCAEFGVFFGVVGDAVEGG
jgi:hypothetical protein